MLLGWKPERFLIFWLILNKIDQKFELNNNLKFVFTTRKFTIHKKECKHGKFVKNFTFPAFIDLLTTTEHRNKQATTGIMINQISYLKTTLKVDEKFSYFIFLKKIN